MPRARQRLRRPARTSRMIAAARPRRRPRRSARRRSRPLPLASATCSSAVVCAEARHRLRRCGCGSAPSRTRRAAAAWSSTHRRDSARNVCKQRQRGGAGHRRPGSRGCRRPPACRETRLCSVRNQPTSTSGFGPNCKRRNSFRISASPKRIEVLLCSPRIMAIGSVRSAGMRGQQVRWLEDERAAAFGWQCVRRWNCSQQRAADGRVVECARPATYVSGGPCSYVTSTRHSAESATQQARSTTLRDHGWRGSCRRTSARLRSSSTRRTRSRSAKRGISTRKMCAGLDRSGPAAPSCDCRARCSARRSTGRA